MWIPSAALAQPASHPFYSRLNQLLDEGGFDAFVERLCAKFYADHVGRPGLAPGIYFRSLFVGYFEGIDSERGIAWRAADSLTIRSFLETGAVAAVTITHADQGDPATLPETLAQAGERIAEIACAVNSEEASEVVDSDGPANVVADKGYHSNDALVGLQQAQVRSYFFEPDRGRRNWEGKPEAKAAVYGNRRRIRGEHGQALLRRRGDLLERSFAHAYETGGLRRTHLRGSQNICKRVLIHIGAFNLGLVMRKLVEAGPPRGLQRAGANGNHLLAQVIFWLQFIQQVNRVTRRSVVTPIRHSRSVLRCQPLCFRKILFQPGLLVSSVVPEVAMLRAAESSTHGTRIGSAHQRQGI